MVVNEHLPECLMYDVKVCMCICLELRACEERVLLAAEKRHEGELADEWQHGVTAGKVIGRMDAREAVDAMEIAVVGNSAATIDQAIAAIDALRKEQK